MKDNNYAKIERKTYAKLTATLRQTKGESTQNEGRTYSTMIGESKKGKTTTKRMAKLRQMKGKLHQLEVETNDFGNCYK